MHGVEERCIEAGVKMCNKCRDLYFYLKKLMRLNKILKEIKLIMNENKMDLTTAIFNKTEDMHVKNVLQVTYSRMFTESYSS